MAATATRLKFLELHSGAQGERVEDWYIEWDADATVELNTRLTKVYHLTSAAVGTGGNANVLSIDETATTGIVGVSAGAVTIDAAGTSIGNHLVRLYGW